MKPLEVKAVKALKIPLAVKISPLAVTVPAAVAAAVAISIISSNHYLTAMEIDSNHYLTTAKIGRNHCLTAAKTRMVGQAAIVGTAPVEEAAGRGQGQQRHSHECAFMRYSCFRQSRAVTSYEIR